MCQTLCEPHEKRWQAKPNRAPALMGNCEGGRKESSHRDYVCRAGSGFLHSHFASGLTCQLQQFINLKAWLSKPLGFGALDQDTEGRAECPALMKHCPADSAPSAKERKAGLALFPKLSEGVGFLLWSLRRSFWDLLIAKRCDIKYGRESHLQLKVTSRSLQPASRNLHCRALALWT